MPEFNSTQMAAVLAGGKILGAEQGANTRRFFSRIVLPSGVAINDTVYFGRMPARSRVVRGSVRVSCSAGTASSILDLGTRLTAPPNTVINSQGIVVGINIAAAGEKNPAGAEIGAFLANGADDTLTASEVDVFGTIRGAAPPANQAIVVEFLYVTD